MEKYRVWFADGSNTYCENMNPNEIVEYYTIYGLEVPTTVTVEYFVNNKYIGEVDYSFEEFQEVFG